MRSLRLSAALFAAMLWLPVQVAGQLQPLSEVFPVWWPETIDLQDHQSTSYPSYPVAAALSHGFAVAAGSSTTDDEHAVEGKLADLSGQAGPHFLGEWVGPGLEPYFGDLAVAATGAGSFILVWNEVGDFFSITYRRFGLGGVPLGDFVDLASIRRGELCRPAVAGNASGGFAVAWEGEGCFFSDSTAAVSVRSFYASGEPATAELSIPMPEGPGVSGRPRVGIDAAGRFVVLWRQGGATDTDPARLCGQAYGVRGGFLGSSFCIGELAGSTGGALAIDPAGSFLAAWFGPAATGTQAPLFVRRYQMNGTPLGNRVQVATAADPSHLTASADGHGNAALSWLEGDRMRVLLIRRDAVVKGPAITISGVVSYPEDDTNGVALADSGRLLVTWWSGGSIRGRLWQARF